MNNIPSTSLIDIIGKAAAFIGAITGSIALIWNIINHLKFKLEIYSHYLSVSYSERASQSMLKISNRNVDLSNYSDNAIILNGWFKLLLRKEGKSYRNHCVTLFVIELQGELKKLLNDIIVDSGSDIILFCNEENEYPKPPEGLPLEIKVHSNPIFLTKDWKNHIDNPAQIKEKISELIDRKYYKINIQLTTYKYPIKEVKITFFVKNVL